MRNTMKDDLLGAGFHILQGAGGDLRLMVRQAVERLMGEGFVTRAEYDRLAARVAALEGKTSKSPKTQAKKASAAPRRASKAKARKPRK